MTGLSDRIREAGEPNLLHIEVGCWCESSTARGAALDVLYPDRCQKLGGPETPDEGRRTCILPANHPEPCRGHLERPGGPCHFCGQTFFSEMCPNCWTSFEGMALADIKAVFAADGTFSVGGLRVSDA